LLTELQVKLQMARYYGLAASVGASSQGNATICEVGFNAGHSAALMLTAAPQANVVVFDIFNHPLHPWAERSLKLMFDAFPKRLSFVKGPSSDTIPWAQSNLKLSVMA
jgi:hypothetical protein